MSDTGRARSGARRRGGAPTLNAAASSSTQREECLYEDGPKIENVKMEAVAVAGAGAGAACFAAAASCATARCGGIATTALRLTMPPQSLLGCRRYSYSVLSFFFIRSFFCYFALLPHTPTPPFFSEASPAPFCLLATQTHQNYDEKEITFLSGRRVRFLIAFSQTF